MKIYQFDRSVIIHFGLGLIGSSFYRMLSDFKTPLVEATFQIDWQNPDIAEAISYLNNKLLDKERNFKVQILWTAGKAGFSADASQTQFELKNFKIILGKLAEELSTKCQLELFFLSSAGGLYEGQTQIGSDSIANPKRHYGYLKLEQEIYINSIVEHFKKVLIVLPSSVFSIQRSVGRRGLINTLIENAQSGKVSQIFGDPTTLRDYVLDDDVSELLLRKMFDTEGKMKFERIIIASGIPVSISDIVKRLELIVGKPLYLRYTPIKYNAQHITYNPNSVSRGKRSRELDYLLRKAIQ